VEECEACIIEFQTTIEIGVKNIQVHGDSNSIINQISKKWKVRNETLAPYQAYFVDLTKNFTHITCTYIPLEDNQFGNALVKLALMINIPSHIPFDAIIS